jgi:hypothetical protein
VTNVGFRQRCVAIVGPSLLPVSWWESALGARTEQKRSAVVSAKVVSAGARPMVLTVGFLLPLSKLSRLGFRLNFTAQKCNRKVEETIEEEDNKNKPNPIIEALENGARTFVNGLGQTIVVIGTAVWTLINGVWTLSH